MIIIMSGTNLACKYYIVQIQWYVLYSITHMTITNNIRPLTVVAARNSITIVLLRSTANQRMGVERRVPINPGAEKASRATMN